MLEVKDNSWKEAKNFCLYFAVDVWEKKFNLAAFLRLFKSCLRQTLPSFHFIFKSQM